MASVKSIIVFTITVMLALALGHFLFGKVLAKAPIVGGVSQKFSDMAQGE